MSLHVASRRLQPKTIAKRYGLAARALDLTSRGEAPWVRFSPFFPLGGIPVPFSPGVESQSVEGIWQGLKVFESCDVDASKLERHLGFTPPLRLAEGLDHWIGAAR